LVQRERENISKIKTGGGNCKIAQNEVGLNHKNNPKNLMEGCIFCKFIKGEVNAAKIYEDEKFFAFLDIRPLNPGHTLLIPKEHMDYVFDINEPLYSELFQTAKKLAKPIQNAVGSKRIGVSIEGFGVAHAHVHLIPINHGYEIDPNRAKSASPEELNEIAEKIKLEIKKLWK
jgi:histidine triad (HIT) family protein